MRLQGSVILCTSRLNIITVGAAQSFTSSDVLTPKKEEEVDDILYV